MDVSELIRKEGLRRGLSHQTIRTYRHCVRKFFSWCRKDPNEVNKADIKSYLDRMIEKGRCGNTINVNLNALKFFYGNILNKRLMINIRSCQFSNPRTQFQDAARFPSFSFQLFSCQIQKFVMI